MSLIERTTPSRGGFFVGWFPHQEPGGRGPPPINFGGGSSSGVLFFRVLDLETSQQRNPPGGGGSFDQHLSCMSCLLLMSVDVCSLSLLLMSVDVCSLSLHVLYGSCSSSTHVRLVCRAPPLFCRLLPTTTPFLCSMRPLVFAAHVFGCVAARVWSGLRATTIYTTHIAMHYLKTPNLYPATSRHYPENPLPYP